MMNSQRKTNRNGGYHHCPQSKSSGAHSGPGAVASVAMGRPSEVVASRISAAVGAARNVPGGVLGVTEQECQDEWDWHCAGQEARRLTPVSRELCFQRRIPICKQESGLKGLL